MSSRLFQEVREKRGLAYAIDASVNGLADTGLIEIQAAVDPGRTGELLAVVRGELDALAAGRIQAEELAHTREHLQGLLYLGGESTENRMEKILSDLSFGASDQSGQAVTVDPAYVREHLADVAEDRDLSRYIL